MPAATTRRLATLASHVATPSCPPIHFASIRQSQAAADGQVAVPPPDRTLSFHLMHPGGPSAPGDPNAAFYLDGVYHLHYILQHPWNGAQSYSFVHLTSRDMLHWEWQSTKLQPSFTGHGMFSGTGFITKDGTPAVIYHGQNSGANQIAVAKDRALSAWEKPYPVTVTNECVVSRHSSGSIFTLILAY